MSRAAHIPSYSEMQRSRNKAKAGRAFTRQYGDSMSSAAESGPRAAVYKGQMGRSHKKATRMQNSGSSAFAAGSHGVRRFARAMGSAGSSSVGIGAANASGAKRARGFSRPFVIVAGVVVFIALLAILVYPAARDYYVSARGLAQVQAELQAVSARNDELQDEIDFLQTDSGVESVARQELGWVKEGENAVVVYGAAASQRHEAGGAKAQIMSGAVKAPETWYSPLLDAFFGVSTS